MLDVCSIAAVLGVRCQAEVCFSIIQAVMVDMVYEKMLERVDYLAVHLNIKSLFPGPGGSGGIIGISVFAGVPFVFV